MRNFFILFFWGISSCLFCGNERDPLLFVYDKNMSPYAGGRDLITAHNALVYTGEALTPKNYYTSREMAGLRAAELLLVWGPINKLSMYVQHEVFGHGFVTRSHKTNYVAKYHISGATSPPFTNGAYTTGMFYYSHTTITDHIVNAIAGIDADNILANQLKLDWLKSGKIDGRVGSLYFDSSMDGWKYSMQVAPSGDIEKYVYDINFLYWSDLSRTKIKKRMWVNFADPFLFYSWIAQMKYVSGEKDFTFPMIPFFGGGYLPSMRCHLAPYGPEWVFQNFVRTADGHPIYSYFKWGSLDGDGHWGAGFEAPEVVTGKYGSIGFKLDYFDQFVANRDDTLEAAHRGLEPWTGVKRIKGVSASVMSTFNLPWLKFAKGFVQVGYKTRGYLPGMPLNKGIIAKSGVALHF